MKVNESKTEVCLLHRKDQLTVQLNLNNQILTSKQHMNVLEVAFDSKLNWQTHIENAAAKLKRALHVTNLIRKHFSKQERFKIITCNYYSILYYNSEIWHM